MRMPKGMAADGHRNRKPCDVRCTPFNIHGKRGGRPAKLGTNARLVDHLEELILELCILRHRMPLINRPRKRLL